MLRIWIAKIIERLQQFFESDLLAIINMKIVQFVTYFTMKATVLWGVTQCTLVQIHRSFIGTRWPCDDRATSISETSVNFYETTRCSALIDSQLHTSCRENLLPHILVHESFPELPVLRLQEAGYHVRIYVRFVTAIPDSNFPRALLLSQRFLQGQRNNKTSPSAGLSQSV
jgi:hypothetical protein